MVILIGGSSHVGKTLISQKLIEKYHYPCTSLDHLKMGFIRSGRTELTVNDDYKMRYWLWPFAAEMVKTAIENNQNMILEGCYIPGEWKDSFSEDYLKEIRCVFIVMSENYLRKNFQSLYDYANVIEKRLDDQLDLERLINCSKEFKEECINQNIPYIEIDKEYNLEEILNQIYKICCA
ncbi:MAG: adenylate kinase [Treponema sp.]|nr:adenylate kinase [Treponema sp.]